MWKHIYKIIEDSELSLLSNNPLVTDTGKEWSKWHNQVVQEAVEICSYK